MSEQRKKKNFGDLPLEDIDRKINKIYKEVYDIEWDCKEREKKLKDQKRKKTMHRETLLDKPAKLEAMMKDMMDVKNLKHTYTNETNKRNSEDKLENATLLDVLNIKQNSKGAQARRSNTGGRKLANPKKKRANPNEKLYCTCQQGYFGRMVACDNADCKYKWFHFDCVGLESPPPPDTCWYCKDCKELMNIYSYLGDC